MSSLRLALKQSMAEAATLIDEEKREKERRRKREGAKKRKEREREREQQQQQRERAAPAPAPAPAAAPVPAPVPAPAPDPPPPRKAQGRDRDRGDRDRPQAGLASSLSKAEGGSPPASSSSPSAGGGGKAASAAERAQAKAPAKRPRNGTGSGAGTGPAASVGSGGKRRRPGAGGSGAGSGAAARARAATRTAAAEEDRDLFGSDSESSLSSSSGGSTTGSSSGDSSSSGDTASSSGSGSSGSGSSGSDGGSSDGGGSDADLFAPPTSGDEGVEGPAGEGTKKKTKRTSAARRGSPQRRSPKHKKQQSPPRVQGGGAGGGSLGSGKSGTKSSGGGGGGAQQQQQQQKKASKQQTRPPPSPALIAWMRQMPIQDQRRHMERGLRVKVRFVTKSSKKGKDGKPLRKLKWYGGLVTDIATGGKKVRIKYDDGTSEVADFPDKDIVVDCQGNGQHRHGTKPEEFQPPPPQQRRRAPSPRAPTASVEFKKKEDGEEKVQDNPDELQRKPPPRQPKAAETARGLGAEEIASLKAGLGLKKEQGREEKQPKTETKGNDLTMDEILMLKGAQRQQKTEVERASSVPRENPDKPKRESVEKKDKPESEVDEKKEKAENEAEKKSSDSKVKVLEKKEETIESEGGKKANDKSENGAVEKVASVASKAAEDIASGASKEVQKKPQVASEAGEKESLAVSEAGERKDRADMKATTSGALEKDVSPPTGEYTSSLGQTNSNEASADSGPNEKSVKEQPGLKKTDTTRKKRKRDVSPGSKSPPPLQIPKVFADATKAADLANELARPLSALSEDNATNDDGSPEAMEVDEEDGVSPEAGSSASQPSSESAKAGSKKRELSPAPSPVPNEPPRKKALNDDAFKTVVGQDAAQTSPRKEQKKEVEIGSKSTAFRLVPTEKDEVEEKEAVEAATKVDEITAKPKASIEAAPQGLEAINPTLTKRPSDKAPRKDNSSPPEGSIVAEKDTSVQSSEATETKDEHVKTGVAGVENGGEKNKTPNASPSPSSSPKSKKSNKVRLTEAPLPRSGRRAAQKANEAIVSREERIIKDDFANIPKKKGKKDPKPKNMESEDSDEEEGNWVQCDRCSKWRLLPPTVKTEILPDRWFCELNRHDPTRNTCDAAEQSAEEIKIEKKLAKETAEKAKPPTPTSPKPPKVKSEVAIERSKSKDAEEGKTDTSMKRKSPDTVSSSNAKGSEPVKPDKSKGDTSQVKKAKKGSTAEIKPSVDMGKSKGKKKQKTGKDAEKEKKASKGIKEKKDDDEEDPDNVEWVQCEKCEKWRKLPSHVSAEDLPEVWYCNMNTWDPSTAFCTAEEDKMDSSHREFQIMGEGGTFTTSYGSSGKLSYRNLIFGTNGKQNRPLSERQRAADSLFPHQPLDAMGMAAGPPQVMYANSSAFFYKSFNQQQKVAAANKDRVSFFDILSQSKLWDELYGGAQAIRSLSHHEQIIDTPDSNPMSEEMYLRSVKALVYHALGTKTLADHEVLLEAQCQEWNDVQWTELRAACTIELVIHALHALIEDGLVHKSTDSTTGEAQYCRSNTDGLKELDTKAGASGSAEESLKAASDEAKKQSRCMKISKPWKRGVLLV